MPRSPAPPAPTSPAPPAPTSPAAPAPASEAPALAVVPPPAPGALARSWMVDASQVYFERETMILALMLGAIGGLNTMVLGPPGTAKTATARAVAVALRLRYYQITFSSWTDDASVLGPVDVPALTSGTMRRHTAGFLPEAELATFDELPRSGRGIRDLVLPVINERTLPDGTVLPLRAVVSTANTALVDDEDRALADRHHLMVIVDRLRDRTNRRAVVLGDARPALPALPPGVLDALTAAAAAVTIPDPVGDAIEEILDRLVVGTGLPQGSRAPSASDRRMQAATLALRAHAALHDRTALTWDDLRVVYPLALADGPETLPAIAYAIEAAVPAWVAQIAALRATVEDLVALARRQHLDGATLTADEAHALVNAEGTILTVVRSLEREHGDDVGGEAKTLALAALDRLDAVADEAAQRRRATRAL